MAKLALAFFDARQGITQSSSRRCGEVRRGCKAQRHRSVESSARGTPALDLWPPSDAVALVDAPGGCTPRPSGGLRCAEPKPAAGRCRGVGDHGGVDPHDGGRSRLFLRGGLPTRPAQGARRNAAEHVVPAPTVHGRRSGARSSAWVRRRSDACTAPWVRLRRQSCPTSTEHDQRAALGGLHATRRCPWGRSSRRVGALRRSVALCESSG